MLKFDGTRIEGEEKALSLLGEIDAQARNFTPLYRGPIDKLVTSLFRRQFKSEGAWGGSHWPALSPSTVRQKAKIGRAGMGMLRRYNDMYSSFVKSGGPGGIRIIEPDYYERGSRLLRAHFHQGGTTKMPQREIVPDPLPHEWVATVERVMAKWFDTGAA